MNKMIEKIMSSKSWEDIEQLIDERINEEKQEYDKISGGNKHSFIAPPTDANDTKVYVEDKFLHPENSQIYISTYPSYSYYFDDEKEIYKLFAEELSKLKNPNDINQISNAVGETVFKYIGGAKVFGNDYDRMRLLKDSTELGDDEKNKISVFKNTKMAWCTERACMAHQLFKFLGIDSKIVMATISNNGEHQIHTFNLVKSNKKTILFDSAVMSHAENNAYNPVAMILEEDVFNKNMVGVNPLPERKVVGASGKVYKIIYDLKNREMNEYTKNYEL